MMFRLASAVACLLALSSAAVACLNMYGTDIHGHSTDMVNESPTYFSGRLRAVELDRTEWVAKEAKLSVNLETADFEHRADYAVTLIYLGQYDEAIRMLEELEQERPGEYIVATNLGTAYELNGDLEKALQWIQAGFERNPEAHNGSEWLHVRILEARIELANDPQWLESHSVLGVDLGSGPELVSPAVDFVDSSGKSHSVRGLCRALEYQLLERLQFVPPQDPVVADLLFDLANTIALSYTVEEALPVYAFAQEYGVSKPELLESRVAHFQKVVGANPNSGRSDDRVFNFIRAVGLFVIAVVLSLLILVPLGYFGFRLVARRKAAGE